MLDHRTISLADQIFEQLETDILSGKYVRGDVLTESKLCEQLGVSRTPIREALRRLEQENLIKETSKGCVVIGITEKDLDDIFIVREQLEGLAASFAASVPHYEPQLGKAAPVTPIFYMENSGLLNCDPTEYVDITDHIETKLKMLSMHESQITWLGDHDGNDVIENTRMFARVIGIQCGVKYAEGFRMANDAFRVVPYRVLP